MSWPVPFFTDNQFGFISTIAQVSPVTNSPPAPQATSTSATRIPPATIGRVNTIISSSAPVEVVHSNVVTPLAPLVTLINPLMMVNHSIDNPNIIKSPVPKQEVGPTVTVINPAMMINHSIDNPNIIKNPAPKQNTEGVEPLITYFDPKYLISYSSTTPSSVPSVTTTSSNTTAIPTSIPTSSLSTSTVSTTIPSAVATNSTSALITNTTPSVLTITKQAPVSIEISSNSTVTTTSTPFTSRPIPILLPTMMMQNVLPTSIPSKSVVPVLSMPMNVFPSNFQVEIPTVVKLDVNITQMPNYIVSISPINNNDSDIVEIYAAASNNVVSSSKLDISDPNLNTGPGPAPLSTTTVMQNRISQESKYPQIVYHYWQVLYKSNF